MIGEVPQPSPDSSGNSADGIAGVSRPEYRQQLFNIGLALWFAGWVGWQTYKVWGEGRLDYVEIAFFAQNIVLIALIVVRKPHRELDASWLRQAVALIAFCSGAFFMGQPVTGGRAAHYVSQALIMSANILGCVTLLNLGRSFGILIARREIKSGGLYGIVRHPMYATDILLRVGFLVSHCSWKTGLVFVLSVGCYIWRALLEERFLSRNNEYRAYLQRVRYRFIPGII